MPTALIVEDEPEANRLLAMLVQLRGYRTDSAFTGGEALEIAASRPPDIVFLDLMLPDINGYEVCRRLKSERATSLIPIVMVTARIAAENRVQSYFAGADQYIPKPYTPDQIFDAMNEADAWRREVGGPETAGEIALTTDSTGVLRELARLRSLLVARTSLDRESVENMAEALETIRSSAAEWGQAHATATVATLEFWIRDEIVTLTVRDGSGWLADHPLAPDRRWAIPLALARFDEVAVSESGRTLTLVRRFGRP